MEYASKKRKYGVCGIDVYLCQKKSMWPIFLREYGVCSTYTSYLVMEYIYFLIVGRRMPIHIVLLGT